MNRIFFVIGLALFAKPILANSVIVDNIFMLKSIILNVDIDVMKKNINTVILRSGIYYGNFIFYKNINLISYENAIITSCGFGSIFKIFNNNIIIKGLTFYNSGKDMFKRDACLFIESKAYNINIINNNFLNCGFSIWVDKSNNNYIAYNNICGTLSKVVSDRGNNIQLFKNCNAIVKNNYIYNGRDGIYISNSMYVNILNNIFNGNRFCVHYMYSHNCLIKGNNLISSSVGTAIMYSKFVKIYNNFSIYNREHGFLFRDILYSKIIYNKSLYNSDGIFLGSSYYNSINNNNFIKNSVAAKVSNGSSYNDVYKNNFIENKQQIKYLDAKFIYWNINNVGNYWSHYIGWDLNFDGIGDKKFYVTNISDWLIFSYPILRIVFKNPSMVLLQKIENQFPAFRKAAIIDNFPLMRPVIEYDK
ncbi:MAG: right-handed parallel beta-helix repeat-containing protein [Candidatus Azosocius agrarius]|nr:MAG: right-handed parallel beta-helix repeat-containing protein [Gammaproteobacteria bacterium]